MLSRFGEFEKWIHEKLEGVEMKLIARLMSNEAARME